MPSGMQLFGGAATPTGVPIDSNEFQSLLALNAQKGQSAAQLAEQQREFDTTMAARQRALAGLLSATTASGSAGTVPQATAGASSASTAGIPAPAPYQPYQSTADASTYARAKDNTGLALQSALKGLQNTMASRGISGSGIEGGETTKLYESGLNTIAGQDTASAQTEAQHAFEASQQGNQLGEQAREFNAGQGTNVSEFNAGLVADAQKQRLSSILQAYGSLY